MLSRLESLPPEILLYTLSHLPVSSLAALSQTSWRLNRLAKTAHTTLHLAIFPKRLHSVLSFLDSPEEIQQDVGHSVKIALPLPSSKASSPASTPGGSPKSSPSPTSGPFARHQYCRSRSPEDSLSLPPAVRRETLIRLSNTRAIQILIPLSATLRTLSLLLWCPTRSLLAHLATACPSLCALSLRFSHPSHRDAALPAFYFESAPKPSAAWDALAGIGRPHDSRLTLRGLEKLTIERAGTSSAQLRGVVASNPRLRQLRLKCVSGADAAFLAWLGQQAWARRASLETLCLTDCRSLELRAPATDDDDGDRYYDDNGYRYYDCDWIAQLKAAGLKSLTVENCEAVEAGVLRRIEREGFWSDRDRGGDSASAGIGGLSTGSADSPAGEDGSDEQLSRRSMGVLEVDPDCL